MRPGSDSSFGADPSRPAASGPHAAPDSVRYRESLRTPWWWYPVAIVVAAILAAEFHTGGINVTAWLPFVILVPLAAVVTWLSGRSALEIRDGEVHIRGAHLPLEFVSGVVRLDPRVLSLVVGREGDPAAFVDIRPWIRTGVQLWLDDEDDPTPYWVVSTRHPDRVVAAVNAARGAGQ